MKKEKSATMVIQAMAVRCVTSMRKQLKLKVEKEYKPGAFEGLRALVYYMTLME